MNRHKLMRIIEYLRDEGALFDQVGRAANLDEVFSCYALDERLTKHEQIILKSELTDVCEAEAVIEQLKIAKAQHAWLSGSGGSR